MDRVERRAQTTRAVAPRLLRELALHEWRSRHLAAAADAQQTPETAAQATPAEQEAQADIVVTARRREERLQDVPIAVTALTGGVPALAGGVRQAAAGMGTAGKRAAPPNPYTADIAIDFTEATHVQFVQ